MPLAKKLIGDGLREWRDPFQLLFPRAIGPAQVVFDRLCPLIIVGHGAVKFVEVLILLVAGFPRLRIRVDRCMRKSDAV